RGSGRQADRAFVVELQQRRVEGAHAQLESTLRPGNLMPGLCVSWGDRCQNGQGQKGSRQDGLSPPRERVSEPSQPPLLSDCKWNCTSGSQPFLCNSTTCASSKVRSRSGFSNLKPRSVNVCPPPRSARATRSSSMLFLS